MSLEDILKAKAQRNREDASPVAWSESKRITSLALCLPLTPEEHAAVCKREIISQELEKGFRFFEPQSAALVAFDLFDGLFAPIGVGWGKTLITLALAERGWRRGISRIFLCIPSHVTRQLTERDIPWARRRIPLTVPFHVLSKRSREARANICAAKKPGCYIISYSLLSTKDTDDVLDAIKPGLLIFDEAHHLRNRKTSARTKRIQGYITEAAPIVAAMSGTITGKSVMDYQHIIRWCLGDKSPLPIASNLAREWAAVLDTGSEPTEAFMRPLYPLTRWAEKNFGQSTPTKETFPHDVSGFRKAYRYRLASAPGVVVTGDNEIGTALYLCNVPAGDYKAAPGWADLEALIRQVSSKALEADKGETGLWKTPNGDEIEHSIHTFKWLYELSAGFYNELVWPTEERLAMLRGVPGSVSADLINRAKEHHRLGQVYAKGLRDFLKDHHVSGCDTPLLVGSEMAAHGARRVGQDLYAKWQDWKAADFQGRPERESHAVRVCSYKVDHAVRWAKGLERDSGAIVWVYHQEMGHWVYEALEKAGVESLYAPAGADKAILDPANEHKVIVASMPAHGTGKNLQAFQHQFFLQTPRDAKLFEQTLGRTHRNGQLADELIAVTCHTIDFDALLFAAALNDSLYIHQSTGVRQKLIYAGYDPMPRIFSHEALKERGFQNQMLSPEQRALMTERFAGNLN